MSIFLTAIMAISIVAMAIPVAVEAQVPVVTVSPTSGRGVLKDGSNALSVSWFGGIQFLQEIKPSRTSLSLSWP
ncbi:MAG: hypothetical protein QW639_05185 [Candidatus Bathyarchaeia archaeon]